MTLTEAKKIAKNPDAFRVRVSSSFTHSKNTFDHPAGMVASIRRVNNGWVEIRVNLGFNSSWNVRAKDINCEF